VNVVEVWVQADVLTVRMTLVPGSQAGVLETLLLKAIRAGANTAEDLGDVFGLAPRLLEGLLGDLWRAGRITVALSNDNELISLTSSGESELEALDEGQSVGSAAEHSTSEEVAHDRLTGRALPIQATRRYPRESKLVVPTMVDDPPPTDLREAELAEALTKTLRWRANEDVDRLGDLRIGAAYLTPGLLQVSTRRRYIPLRVAATADAAGALTVQVIDENLPIRARELASKRLQGLIADQPTSKFVAHLRSNAQPTPLQVRSVSQVISDLQRTVDALPTCPPANRQREHDRAAALAGQVAAYTQALALTEMDVEVIQTAEQHRLLIARMLQRAERQVVMAVPWVKPHGVEGVREALIAAVRRGVQITILWGITAGADNLDDNVHAAFEEIERNARAAGRGGALRFHRERGAKSHAKLVAADDRELLVTSKNFLSGSDRSELGLFLTAVEGRACPVIEEVLQFLYDHTPDPATAFQLIRTRGAFGLREDETEPAIPVPRLKGTVLEANAPQEHVRAWAISWQETARMLAARATRPRPTVEVIKDGQHGPLVREALTGAKRRVLVTSDKVTQQALTAETYSLVRAKAADGLEVALRYADPTDEESKARLCELSSLAGPNRPNVARHPNMHAKVVVRDDSTVLGSFNHLSVDAGARGLRATGELSVRVMSAEVAETVWSSILGRADRLPTAQRIVDGSPVADNAAAARMRGAPIQRLAELVRPETGPPDVDAIVALVKTEGVDTLLSAVRQLGFGVEGERRLRAAAAVPALAAAGPDCDARLVPLLESVWAEGAWACADLIRGALVDTALRPRAVLTRALAAPGDRVAALQSAATSDQPVTAAEAEVLAVSTCVGLLLGELDDPNLAEVLRTWERPTSPPSDAFTTAAVDYWVRYGPLPAEPLAGPTPPAETIDVPGLRAALTAAVESLRRYDSHSDSGNAVRDFLFSPDGEMCELVAVVGSADDAGLRAWEAAHNDPNDSRWLNKVTKAANQPVIDDRRRVSFTAKRRDIRLAANALAAALAEREEASRPELPPEQAVQIWGMLPLVREVSEELLEDERSPEALARRFEAGRLLGRLTGAREGGRPAPGARQDSWALPEVRIALADAGPSGADSEALLPKLCRDLVAAWACNEAVRFLLQRGEFALADFSIVQLREEGRIGGSEESSLRRERAAARTRAEDLLDVRTNAIRLRCDRAGIDDGDRRWRGPWTLGERLPQTLKALEDASSELDKEIRLQQVGLSRELESRRAELDPGWADYVAGLIKSEELAVAALALTPSHRNGRPMLPQPIRLSSWSWRWLTPTEAARWFEADCEAAPRRIKTDFAPEPVDLTAQGILTALRSLAGSSPQAAEEWVAAVQALVAQTDSAPLVRASGHGATAEFLLPYDVRLPRLRWVGQPITVTVGDTNEQSLLHFSLELTEHRRRGAVVSVSDILTLLGRDPAGRPASTINRALLFLSMVCSRLPLEQVIAPQDTPAEYLESRRMSLAWLLSILGFSLKPTDLDMLRVLGGGHPIPLWHLIDAARDDPIDGIKALWDRADLQEILIGGLTRDLDNDEDLLVLGTLLIMESQDRLALKEDLALVWYDGGGDPAAVDTIDLAAVIARLIAKGYLEESDGRLRSCSCAVVRALRRTEVDGRLHRAVQRINATQGIRDLVYRDLLDMARHQDQAETALRSPQEWESTARRNSEALMSQTTPFDLRKLCNELAQWARLVREDVDIYWESAVGDPVWVTGPEMGFEYLVRELLTNAIGAASERRDGEIGSVSMELNVVEKDNEAQLTVKDDGPGFPEDYVAAFRDRQVVHYEDRPHRGKGLRLYQSFGEARGAALELGQRSDGGAVVTVRLPLVAAPPDAGAA
jgi:hypothetical protein